MDTLYPVNAVAGAPAYTGRMLRQANSVFLAGATAARPLGARSGVRPGTSLTTVAATSTTWTCGPFAGVIDGEAAAEAGPYEFSFDSVATGTMTTADGAYPRVDAIYVQVDDPSESDGTSAPVVRRGYLAGTVLSGGTLVVATVPPRSFVVAQINVPKSGGGAPTASLSAPYAVGAGGIIPVPTKAVLDLIPGVVGQHATVFGDSPSKNGDYAWDGTAWQPDRRMFGATAGMVGGVPPAGAKILEQSGTVGVTTSAGGDTSFDYPVAFPTGVLSVHLQRRDFRNFGVTIPILSDVQTLSTLNFRLFNSTGAAAVNLVGVPFVFTALGW